MPLTSPDRVEHHACSAEITSERPVIVTDSPADIVRLASYTVRL